MERQLFGYVLIVVLAFTASACASADKGTEQHMNPTDRYGGWTGKKYPATGFFRVEKDDRWWMVTPEGNAFLSFGINHYHAGWWIQEYNEAHWTTAFGAARAGDTKWHEGFREVAQNDLDRLGINTLGMHTDAPSLTDKPYEAVVPYLRSFKPIVLDHYRHPEADAFMDVFSPEFEQLCNETALEVAAPYADDPMLLGYCMSDCPIFTDLDISVMGGSTSWSRLLPNLGAQAPGKQAFVAAMKKRYSNVAAFNAAYQSSFSSWTDLLETEQWRPDRAPVNEHEKADNLAFTLLCVDRYYAVSKAALHAAHPNHLFFGDKLNGNTDNMDRVLEVAAKYVDVILYQYYDHWAGQEALLEKLAPRVDVPFINGDAGFSVSNEMMPNPHGPHARDQAERAVWLLACGRGGFARPEFIGWHMCGVIDTWKTMPGKEQAQHQGLMTVTGEFYPEMEQAVQRISSEMYQIAGNE